MSGLDAPVRDYVMGFETAQVFAEKLEDMIRFLIPNYIAEGKNQLVIAVGCTGGKHRSVTLAQELYRRLEEGEGYGIRVEHRDIEKDAYRKGVRKCLFSSDVKEELSRQVPSARHCQIAEVAAIVSFCGHVKITALNRFSIRIQTENVWVARKFFTLLRKTFKIDTEIAVRRSNNQKKSRTYVIAVLTHDEAIRILQASKLLNGEMEVEEPFFET